jgi:predicted nucleotidyltransferase
MRRSNYDRISSSLYIVAARAIARVLASPGVRSVFIRRSVATGDAVFPLSDLDLGLLIGDIGGSGMADLYRRLQYAKTLFPRIGEVQVTTAGELDDMAESDPYRANLDRRSVRTVYGEHPAIPQASLSPMAVARRLVFWLDHYLPWTVRHRRRRDQRKLVLEMWNALSVLQGRWPEPQLSRRAVHEAWKKSGLDDGAPPFVQCCRIAEQAHGLLGRKVPDIDCPILVPASRPIVLLPRADSTWVPEAWRPKVRVLTPRALDLLMTTQDPFIWFEAREQLQAVGFAIPSRGSWITACLRHAGGERLRRPGFSELGPGQHARRLARLSATIAWLEGDQAGDPSQETERVEPKSVAEYYRGQFDKLTAEAALLRRRARALAAG